MLPPTSALSHTFRILKICSLPEHVAELTKPWEAREHQAIIFKVSLSDCYKFGIQHHTDIEEKILHTRFHGCPQQGMAVVPWEIVAYAINQSANCVAPHARILSRNNIY